MRLPNILTLLALFFCAILSAQSYKEVPISLQWEVGSPGFENNLEVRFDGAIYERENSDLGYFAVSLEWERWRNADVALVNVVAEPISSSLFDNEEIPTEWELDGGVKMARTKPYLTARIFPFRRTSNGNVERLVSASLNFTQKNSPNNTAQNARWEDNSVLMEGQWYRVGIKDDGVYRITSAMLSSMGADANGLSTDAINVYGNGGELLPFENSTFRRDDLAKNNILINGGEDGTFDQGDEILFYGKGPDKWRYNQTSANEANWHFEHVKHHYMDSAYYYIRIDDTVPKRVSALAEPTQPADEVVSSFVDYAYWEQDNVNFVKSGREYFGEKFGLTLQQNFNFQMPNLVGGPVRVEANVAARSFVVSSFTAEAGGVSENISIGSISDGATSNIANVQGTNFIYNEEPGGNSVGVSLTYNQPEPVSEGWLDYITVQAERELELSGQQMHFRNLATLSEGGVTEFVLSAANSGVTIWDITDVTEPNELPTTLNAGEMRFKAENVGLRQFVAFGSGSAIDVSPIGPVTNQNLHGLENIDYVILAYEPFMDAAVKLADIHRADGLSVEIVTQQQVYNEFSSGSVDPTAIKMLMKMLYERATTEDEKPRYLLLFGDGSYDNKTRSSNNSNLMITFQSLNSVSPTNSYVSDDYFVLLDDNEGESITDKLDAGVGRLPARSASEADNLVEKIANYKGLRVGMSDAQNCNATDADTPYGSWRNQIVLITDDQDGNGNDGLVHMQHSEQYADTIRKRHLPYDISKIYLDSYQQVSTPGGERYPEAQENINTKVNQGALIVNYVGHGGEKGWAHERILDIPTIQGWENYNRLPVFMTATCELSRFDDPEFTSAGELIMLNPNGGAIAMLTTTRIVYSNQNNILTRAFYDVSLEDKLTEGLRLGDILKDTKNATTLNSSVNKRNFSLLGDPALAIAYPKFDVVTTTINDQPLSEDLTISALQRVTVAGSVMDDSGQKLTDFNGVVFPTVYDKQLDVVVQNNDDVNPNYSFDLFKNVIYKGKASVTNGDFSFTFLVPKDISYTNGLGRISYYALDGTDFRDGHGASELFSIGGTSSETISDAVGPEVELFIDTEAFVDGGLTDQTPLLIAKLFDESGINTVGNGIGHDITATIDQNSSSSLVLNDFYEASLDEYQKGQVKFELPEMEEGTHTLTLKVWDILNNSSERVIDFVVANNEEVALDHVLNYPNPFTTNTSFMFEHNQNCEVLDVQIQVFSISGKLVKSINTFIDGHTVNSERIPWDGRDDFGDKIGKGVYVYKLKVTSPLGSSAEEFEKLVILN